MNTENTTMAQTENVTQTKFKKSCLEISIHGVIKAIEQIRSERGDFYANTIILPAEDLMSKPTRLVVYSLRPLGEEESIVDTIITIKPSFRMNNGKWFFNCSLWREKAAN